jgi:hypothetical protein
VTLWNLPAELEDEFELRWEEWLDDVPTWVSFFEQLQSASANLESELLRAELVTDADVQRVRKLRRAAEQRAVPIPGMFSGSIEDISALALAFTRGEPSNLAVPYQPWDSAQ